MEHSKLNFFKSKLTQEKNQLLDQIINSKKNMDVDHNGDEVDQVQANQILELDSQLSNRISRKIRDIDLALERFENNLFGICEDCDEDIPEKRLMFNTCLTLCVVCAEEREFEANQRAIK